jgi:nucleoside-diphosphate-sugar epimerase
MKVLVTGHLGYIGTVLTPMLIAEGHDVVGLDSDLYQRSTFGDPPTVVPTYKIDLRDVTIEDLVGFDAVIHLAGLSNDPLGNLNPSLTFEINHTASVKLAKLAKHAGVRRFLFSSSCSTYGAAGDDFIGEETEFNPVTPYGQSKVLVEQDVSKLASDTFSPTYLRNATAFGVSPRLRFDLVLNNLVAWAHTTGQVLLKSDGTPWRPIVHVEDISRAFIAVLHAPIELIHNQAFNVGQKSENYQIRELAQIVSEVVPESRVEYADEAGPDKRNYRVDSTKIEMILPEYKPTWTAKRGAEELFKAYQEIGITLEEFEGPRYKRLAQIKQLQEEGLLDSNLRWTSSDEGGSEGAGERLSG